MKNKLKIELEALKEFNNQRGTTMTRREIQKAAMKQYLKTNNAIQRLSGYGKEILKREFPEIAKANKVG